MELIEERLTAFRDAPVLVMRSDERPWWLEWHGTRTIVIAAEGKDGEPIEFGVLSVNVGEEYPTVAEATERMLLGWTDDTIRDWYLDAREGGPLSW